MLIDMHAHTKGISRCCRIDAPEMIEVAKEAGLDGVVLTNHYQKSYVQGDDADAFAAGYVAEYHRATAEGRAQGMLVLFGVEVTMAKHAGAHVLIYGLSEDFVLRYPALYDYTLPELYRLVSAEGGVLVQAHPLRGNKNALLDTQYLSGIEISCHPLYEGTHLDEISRIARQTGLILTCGGDYHADTRRPRCGMYLPEDTVTGAALAAYLKTAPEVKLLVDEVDDLPPFTLTFQKNDAVLK